MKRSKSKSIVDLTPLLDVVLILLFALLMTMSVEQDAVKAEASALDAEVEAAELEKESLSETIEEQSRTIEKLEDNLGVFADQSQVIDEALLKWFVSEGISDKEFVIDEDVEGLFDKEKTNQSLYQMDFIADQFIFIEVEIDSENFHQVLVNGETTDIQLIWDISKDTELQANIASQLYDTFEKEIVDQNGKYSFILFTLKDSGGAYKYALELVWGVIIDIETKYNDQNIYKLKYLAY